MCALILVQVGGKVKLKLVFRVSTTLIHNPCSMNLRHRTAAVARE